MSMTIKDFWKKIHMICGCHDDNEVPMMIQQGPSSLFYSCPRYYPVHRKPGEVACANRINLIDYEEMINIITDKIAESQEMMEEADLVGWKFKNKRGDIEFRIVRMDEDGNYIVRMKSRRALR